MASILVPLGGAVPAMSQHLYAGWSCHASAISMAGSVTAVGEHYESKSCPLQAQRSVKPISGGEVMQPARLPMFGSVPIATLPEMGQAPLRKRKRDSADVGMVAYTGGPIWCLDWCPRAAEQPTGSASQDPSQVPDFVAVGVHPRQRTHNRWNTRVAGPAMVQLWGTQADVQSDTLAMELALWHEGGVTFDCKWCPDPCLRDAGTATHATALPRLGLLALVLGSGEVQVLAVPHPAALADRQDLVPSPGQELGAGSRPGGALHAVLQPVARISGDVLEDSLPCCISWLPREPHNLLVVGCWDGTVAVCRMLPPAVGGHQPGATPQTSTRTGLHSMAVLCHFQADSGAIRGLAWLPSQVAEDGGGATRHIFMCTGNSGNMRIWDYRDPWQPLLNTRLNQKADLTSLDWSGRTIPFGCLVTTDEGALIFVLLEPWDAGEDFCFSIPGAAKSTHGSRSSTQECRGTNEGALWDVHTSRRSNSFGGRAAYAGEDGELTMALQAWCQDNRQRASHYVYAGFHQEGEVLHLRLSQYYTARPGGCYTGTKPPQGKNDPVSPLPAPEQAIYRVRWGPDTTGGAEFLIFGGAAGFLVLTALI